MKSHIFWPFWLIGILVAGILGHRVNPMAYTGGRSRDDEERLRRNSSAIATMLGEFRTSMSDIMFIKTERYLHAGVGYVPHMAESVMTAEQLSEEVDEHQSELGIPDDDHHHHPHDPDLEGFELDHDHAGTPTLIPAAERDFRGFIGRLHREVKPWRDPEKAHIHTDGRELLPWFRMMTLTDPNYVRGFVAGGFWLQTEGEDLAIDFINEGLRLNPDAFQLYVSRGFLTIRQYRRLNEADEADKARDRLQAAHADFSRGAELALLERPEQINEDGTGPGGWTTYHEGDAMAAVNMHVVTTRLLGDVEASVRLARIYLEHFPDFVPLQNALNYE
ncbi:MAG: hypothetical protein LAT79_18025 [Kiritimatiellae bacterium]|nr:hypothetical protein [Kiritimatiellia bacterium]